MKWNFINKKQLLINYKMIIKKTIHQGYLEYLEISKKEPKLTNHFGKYQYHFISDLGEISLIELPNYYDNGNTIWEIFCLNGNLFEDTIRFNSFNEAKEKCKELLG